MAEAKQKSATEGESRFTWIPFYKELAEKLSENRIEGGGKTKYAK